VDYRELSGAAGRDAETPGADTAAAAAGTVEPDPNQGGLFGAPAASGRPAVDVIDTVDGPRQQLVLPGAERISTGELLARQQAAPGTQAQRAGQAGDRPTGDLPLFGDPGRQGQLLDPARLEGITLRQEVVIAETGERMQMERPAAAVLAESDARVARYKALLACLRR
jgi:hypothetical protein